MKGLFTATLALAGAAYAAPAADASIAIVDANFDDIKVIAPASVQPVGVYRGLDYDGFNVLNVGTAVTGVKASSPPNVANQDVVSSGGDNTVNLKTAGKTKYFALQQFNFGCVLATQETLDGLPTSCTVKLTGSLRGKTLVTQSISYNPAAGTVLAPMKNQKFDGRWAAVDNVSFQLTSTLAAGMSVLYDDVQYVTYSS